IWIGGGFAPDATGSDGLRRSGEAEFGTRIDFNDDDAENLSRLHILEGRLDPGQGYVGVTALTYDLSHVYANAPIRITTFIGKPRRFDLELNVGLLLEAGRF